jgi:hypothetical protein
VKSASSKNPSASLEVAVAVALTFWVIVLHLTYLTHAGALWRDEAEAIGFASMPSLTETFQSLHYGNFPPLFATVARCWTLAGLDTDTDYRILGCLIGLGTLGALWFGARALGARAPLLALALFAANPVDVRIGDSMRSYGLGIILLVLTQTLIWKYVQSPRRSSWAAATVAAILSVQCLYQSSWFILAFCAGAWTVTLAQKQWKTAAGVGLIGAAGRGQPPAKSRMVRRHADFRHVRGGVGCSAGNVQSQRAMDGPGVVRLFRHGDCLGIGHRMASAGMEYGLCRCGVGCGNGAFPGIPLLCLIAAAHLVFSNFPGALRFGHRGGAGGNSTGGGAMGTSGLGRAGRVA